MKMLLLILTIVYRYKSFAYCNNNPVIYSDPTGYISSIDIYGSHLVPGTNISGHSKYDFSAVNPRLNLIYSTPEKPKSRSQ